MRLGVAIKDTWNFFNEIYADMVSHHQTSLFKPTTHSIPLLNSRLNSYLFKRDLNNFMRCNDVVFFEWASELLVEATQLPKTCGIVTRLHRYEMYQYADRVNWDAVDKIILVSEAKQREFSVRFPRQMQKTVVIPEGISIERFSVDKKVFTGDIGTLCHITPRKRVYDLILAFYELLQQKENFHLHIGGGKKPKFLDYYEAVHVLVDKLKIGDKVTFYGHVNNPPEWYQNIDIFISNSYSEGLQVSPMEAMASGCYCLAHRWAGSEELLPEENLFYSERELINHILDYSNCGENEKLQKRYLMREIVSERCDIEKIQDYIRKIIEEVSETTTSSR